MLQRAQMKHHVPGRMRVRLSGAKGNPERLQQVSEALAAMPGIQGITVSAVTGTVVLKYAPDLHDVFAGRLAGHAAELGLFHLAQDDDEQPRSLAGESIEHALGAANRAIQAGTGNGVSLKELFPFSVAAYAVLFVDKAIAASQWLSWIQFAFSSYVDLHQNGGLHTLGRKVDALREAIADLHHKVQEIALREKS